MPQRRVFFYPAHGVVYAQLSGPHVANLRSLFSVYGVVADEIISRFSFSCGDLLVTYSMVIVISVTYALRLKIENLSLVLRAGLCVGCLELCFFNGTSISLGDGAC